jgi:hypothetical protein
MQTLKHLDYLAVRFENHEAYKQVGDVAIELLPHAPIQNYDETLVFESGARLFIGKDNAYLHAGGEALQHVRVSGQNERDYLRKLRTLGGMVTRIDIAVTVQYEESDSSKLLPHQIAQMIARDEYTSRLSKEEHETSPDMTVRTAYLGNRKKRKRLFRAYDKGHQSGLVDDFLVRFELENREKNAMRIANAIVKDADIGGLIRNYVDFPECDLYQQIMDSESTGIEHLEELPESFTVKNAKLWLWLQQSAAPALGRALARDSITKQSGYSQFIYAVEQAQRQELRRLNEANNYNINSEDNNDN